MTTLVDSYWARDKYFMPGWKPATRIKLGHELDARMKAAECIVAHNVSEYYFADNPKEVWGFPSDFPCIVPPFRSTFVELARPSRMLSEAYERTPEEMKERAAGMPRRWGVLYTVERLSVTLERIMLESSEGKSAGVFDTLAIQFLDKLARGEKPVMGTPNPNVPTDWATAPQKYWLMQASLFTEKTDMFGGDFYDRLSDDDLVGPLGIATHLLNEEGDVAGNIARSFGDEKLNLACPEIDFWSLVESVYMWPAYLALSFMNADNVRLEDVRPPPKLNKARLKRGREPLVTYKVLHIQAMKEILEREGGVKQHGLPKALHICRGHFKDYRKGKGLFGKLKGRYWFVEQERGKAELGAVVKDYDLSLHEPKKD